MAERDALDPGEGIERIGLQAVAADRAEVIAQRQKRVVRSTIQSAPAWYGAPSLTSVTSRLGITR